MRAAAALVSLLVLLAIALWATYGMWNTFAGSIPVIAYVAMAATLAFSLLIGGGLMALMFYSSRRGYDEAAATRLDEMKPERRDPS